MSDLFKPKVLTVPQSDIEKAIAAAKAQGLTRYRVVKEGRKIIVEVSERDEHTEDAIDAEEAMKKAVGA